MKKPRSDATLKTLPEDRQEQIIGWIDTPKSETTPGGYQHAREQLAADGIKCGISALSDFYSWWHLRQFYSEAANFAEDQAKLMKDFDPADTDRAEAFGDHCFLQLAMKAQSTKDFVALRSIRETSKHRVLKERMETKRLEIAERRVVVLETNMKAAQAEVAKLRDPQASLSTEERAAIVAKVDEILGIK